MKKSLVLLLVFMVFIVGALPISAAPAAQLPASELATLAHYFPAETSIFATIRSDSAYLDTLDGLIANVLDKLPAGSVPPLSVRMLLDQAAQSMFSDSFENSIAPWLGDYLAFGVVDQASLLQNDPRFLIAIGIRDRAAATAVIEGLFARFNTRDTVTVTEDADGYTLFAPNEEGLGGAIAVNDEILLLAIDADAILAGRENALSANATFQTTIGLLPAATYDALIFSDLSAALGAMQSAAPMDAATMSAVVGAQAIGVTTLNGRTLAIDAAWNSAADALSTLGLDMGGVGAVDLAFMDNVPANAGFVLHAANLKGLYDAGLALARTNAPEPAQIDQGLAFVGGAVESMTGLNLQTDIISWLDGDYAVFGSIDGQAIIDALLAGLRNDPLVNDQDIQEAYIRGDVNMNEFQQNMFVLERLPLGFGMVIEATDAAKAQNFAGGLAQALSTLATQNSGATVTQTQIGGVEATLISLPVFLTPNNPLPLEIVIGANDKVFVIATRTEAESILSGAPGLGADPIFTEAAGYVLDGASSVWYLDGRSGGVAGAGVGGLALLGPSIGNIFCNIVASLEPTPVGTASPSAEPTEDPCVAMRRQQLQSYIDNNRQMQEMIPQLYQMAGSFISSGSFSTAYTAEGQTLARFALTLAP